MPQHTDRPQAREAVFATRQSLSLMKGKLKGAQTGHDLLKRKSEALTKYAIAL
jgi:V-type H+-transporting ATPase subunit D